MVCVLEREQTMISAPTMQVTFFVDELAVVAVFWWVTVLCGSVVIYTAITLCSFPTCLIHTVQAQHAACGRMSPRHGLCNVLPFSTDLFFHSVLVDLRTAIILNIIFKTSAVRWLRKGGQAEHPCSREKRSGRNFSADTPRDVVRRGQGSNTPVGQESGC